MPYTYKLKISKVVVYILILLLGSDFARLWITQQINVKQHNYSNKTNYNNRKLLITGQIVTDNRADSH